MTIVHLLKANGARQAPYADFTLCGELVVDKTLAVTKDRCRDCTKRTGCQMQMDLAEMEAMSKPKPTPRNSEG